ncbi:MAG: hypothetical protein HC905_00255 [Bacteroidales bacterium]|nr:hypothetical protein [Bacteroidales bacterium]
MKYILFLTSALIGCWISVSAKNRVVEVNNARELIGALGSERTIYLKSGIYNLSYNDSLYQLSAWYSRDTSFSSRGGVFHDLKNVKFIGIGEVKIITNNYFEWVVNFINCKGLYFENMTIGHDTPSECEGGTAYFKNSSDISLKKVGLYGCGTVGLELNNIEDFYISESEIFKCTYNLIEIRESKNVRFNEVTFRESGQTDMLIFDKNGTITFTRCIFRDNTNR